MDDYYKKRIAELTPAAERGDKAAMFKLAETYACVASDCWNITKQELIKYSGIALRWLEASANANYLPALIELARIYENELGDIRYGIYYGNRELAQKYRAKASKLGKA